MGCNLARSTCEDDFREFFSRSNHGCKCELNRIFVFNQNFLLESVEFLTDERSLRVKVALNYRWHSDLGLDNIYIYI